MCVCYSVCMVVCVCYSVCMYNYVCCSVCAYMRMCVLCVHMCMCACVCTCVHACVRMCVRVCAHLRVCICVCVCVSPCTYTHAYYCIYQDKVITFLDELSDEALKKEATSEAKSDTFSVIMKVCAAALCPSMPEEKRST